MLHIGALFAVGIAIAEVKTFNVREVLFTSNAFVWTVALNATNWASLASFIAI